MISTDTEQTLAPVVAGSGLLALDVIFGPDGPVALPGGTCANVLLSLGEMGHVAMPIARLGQDQPGMLIDDEFRRVGAVREGLCHDPSVSTPIILQHWHSGAKNEKDHRFSFLSPTTGNRLPSYQTISDTLVEKMAPRLAKIAVFFFDRVSSPVLRAVGLAKRGGAKIIFEPSSIDNPALFQEAMELSHIVKFSEERLGTEMESLLPSVAKPGIMIETKGRNGMEVTLRGRSGSKRVLMKARNAPRIIDSCGSGDTVSAILIHLLLTHQDDKSRAILEYLSYGQEMAAINCGFLGARGAFLSLGWDSLKSNHSHHRNRLRKMITRTDPFAGLGKGKPGTLFLPHLP